MAGDSWNVRITSHSRAEVQSKTGAKTVCAEWLAGKVKAMAADGERFMVEWHKAEDTGAEG